MLTAKELDILKTIMSQCGQKQSVLVAEEKLLASLKNKNFSAQDLEDMINSLQVEGYFDVIRCYRGQNKLFCFTPKLKGRYYQRERKQLYGNLVVKVLFAVLGSVVAFIVTRLLYGLF